MDRTHMPAFTLTLRRALRPGAPGPRLSWGR